MLWGKSESGVMQEVSCSVVFLEQKEHETVSMMSHCIPLFSFLFLYT